MQTNRHPPPPLPPRVLHQAPLEDYHMETPLESIQQQQQNNNKLVVITDE